MRFISKNEIIFFVHCNIYRHFVFKVSIMVSFTCWIIFQVSVNVSYFISNGCNDLVESNWDSRFISVPPSSVEGITVLCDFRTNDLIYACYELFDQFDFFGYYFMSYL